MLLLDPNLDCLLKITVCELVEKSGKIDLAWNSCARRRRRAGKEAQRRKEVQKEEEEEGRKQGTDEGREIDYGN